MAESERHECAAEIAAHYAEGREQARLTEGGPPLELVRTQEILLRHLPPPPGVILDVGGGPGAYAIWLTGRGYAVHLIDPVPLHLEQARSTNQGAGIRSPEYLVAMLAGWSLPTLRPTPCCSSGRSTISPIPRTGSWRCAKRHGCCGAEASSSPPRSRGSRPPSMA